MRDRGEWKSAEEGGALEASEFLPVAIVAEGTALMNATTLNQASTIREQEFRGASCGRRKRVTRGALDGAWVGAEASQLSSFFRGRLRTRNSLAADDYLCYLPGED